MSAQYWSAPPIWRGETAFILAGGPSALGQDLSLLNGRRVIAVNSAWETWPECDFLFFADFRWLRDMKPAFTGPMVTICSYVAPEGSRWNLKNMRKAKPDHGLAMARDSLAVNATSVTGAINLAVHFGAERIVLLGVDGKVASNGRRHNHGRAYPWPLKPDSFARHIADFALIAPSLKSLGVAVANANPDSAVDIWPRMSLAEAVA